MLTITGYIAPVTVNRAMVTLSGYNTDPPPPQKKKKKKKKHKQKKTVSTVSVNIMKKN